MLYMSDLLYPSYLKVSNTYHALLSEQNQAVESLSNFIDSLMDEITPGLTQNWVRDWEVMLDIHNTSDQTIEERRSRIISKLRSSGDMTEKRIEEIALSFKNGEVLVTEDIDNYTITIKFVSKKGIPSNFEDLKETIRKVRPAHLAVVYEFSYNTRNYLSQFSRNKLANYTRDDLKIVDI